MMDWSAISNMIIKASDNINRGAENASKAGEGNNGVDYSDVSTGSEKASVGGGYQAPGEQSTSSTQSIADSTSKLTDMGKDALSNIGKDDPKKEEAAETTDTSDERLKNIFGDDKDAIEVFSKLNSIEFKYNDKAKQIHPNGENNVDDDLHYGLKAQDLEKSPLTEAVVSEDNSGYKQVNTAELTMVNSAVISDICKRLLAIEKVLGIKVV
jgi:hypothetical protein